MIKAAYLQLGVGILCVATTIYAFHTTRELNRARSESVFATLAEDNRNALIERVKSYRLTLDSAAGYVAAAGMPTLADWRRYVATLNIERRLPGINGLGIIVPVKDGEEAAFLERAAQRGVTGLQIHPETGRQDHYVIQYIEPLEPNARALGLDIAFEQGRRNAANFARDTGEPQMTPRILLVQDATESPGFLLLRPVYDPVMPTASLAQRRAAFRAWIYAPFLGKGLLETLGGAGSNAFHLAVYDGAGTDPDSLIYDSAETAGGHVSRHSVVRTFNLYGRQWTAEWRSTAMFEAAQTSNGPLVVLLAGLGLTALIALLFRNVASRARIVERLVKQRTRELKATVDKNQSIIDTAMVGIVLLDESLVVVSVNRAIRSILGYDVDEAKGRPLGELIAGFTLPEGTDHQRVFTQSRDGAALVLDMAVNRWTNASGRRRYTVMIRDISQEHRATRRLAQSEERWNLALKGAEIGVFDLDLTTGESVVSDTWKQLMQLPLDDPELDPQKEFLARVHPDDMPQLFANDHACITGATSRSITEFRWEIAPGQWRWMRSDALVVDRDPSGRALRFVGAQTDITDLRDAQEALAASREQFRIVLENAPAAMGVLTEDGSFRRVNEAMCTLTGYSAEALVTMRFRELIRREELAELYSRMNELRETDKRLYQHELRIIRNDGQEIWGLVSVAWNRDLTTGEDIFIAQVQDITEIKRVERIKSEFVATVSHELRTPLTSIKGAIGLINGTMKGSLSSTAERLLSIAETNCNRLITLVNDILDMEKISSGEIDFDVEDCSLSEQIEAALEQMAPYANQYRVRLRADPGDTDLTVRIDPGRVVQVLLNLMSNAAKFSEPDQEVILRARAVNGFARVEVIDQGSGIPEEFRERIFQPFSQADSTTTRHKQGTGLGLNISRQIIERLGGQIGFESRSGEGTTFWFTVPLGAQEDAAKLPAKPAARAVTRGKPRVLHVENDRDFTHVVSVGLGGSVDLVAAHSLKEARNHLAREQFDLIILDWVMPDGDASVLLDQIDAGQNHGMVIGLSAQERRTRDPRVKLELVKSRTSFDKMVDGILHAIGERSGKTIH